MRTKSRSSLQRNGSRVLVLDASQRHEQRQFQRFVDVSLIRRVANKAEKNGSDSMPWRMPLTRKKVKAAFGI